MIPGVYVSRTAVPTDRLTDILVRVINVRKEPFIAKARVCLANLQPVSVIEFFHVEGRGEQNVKSSTSNLKTTAFAQKLIDGVDISLPDSTRRVLVDILTQHSDVFSQLDDDLGTTDIVTHFIDIGNAKPIRKRLRRYPPAHMKAISQQVDDYLRQGVIEPASSAWASNLVLVKKKDGSYHCCVDYRRLNAVTRKDAYPLPRIDVCLDATANAKWFSTLDLKSSYHQLLVTPSNSDKAAFICPREMYKF